MAIRIPAHAGMYEGISILGCVQMHILDPPMDFKNLAQVMGRVVRLHSHDTLHSPPVFPMDGPEVVVAQDEAVD